MATVPHPGDSPNHDSNVKQYHTQGSQHDASSQAQSPPNGYLVAHHKGGIPDNNRIAGIGNGYINSQHHPATSSTGTTGQLVNGHVAHGDHRDGNVVTSKQVGVPSRLRDARDVRPVPHHLARDVYLQRRAMSDPQARQQTRRGSPVPARRSSPIPDRARVPQVPGLRPEVHGLSVTNHSNSAAAPNHYHRYTPQRQLYEINEDAIVEEHKPMAAGDTPLKRGVPKGSPVVGGTSPRRGVKNGPVNRPAVGDTTPRRGVQNGPLNPPAVTDTTPRRGVQNGPVWQEVRAVPFKGPEEAHDWGALFVDNTLKEGQELFHVPAILPNGKHIMLTGEVGMRIKDLVSAAAMEYRLPECRIKLARTRAQLNDDANAQLVASLQIKFEERSPAPSSSCKDDQSALLSEFLRREVDYLESLQSYFLTYEEPLSQLPSLSLEEKRLLFCPLKPFLNWSKRLISQVAATLRPNPSVLWIAKCFPPPFWQEYRNYYSTYKSIRELLNHLRETNEEFVEYCKELRGAARQSLDSLLLLPVQRVGQYDVFLSQLMEQTTTAHPDYKNIRTASSIVNKMVKEREEEVSQAENEARLLQVQERFPGDELCLLAQDCFKAQKFKALAARRRSAPSAIKSVLASKAKVVAERSSQAVPTSDTNRAPSPAEEPTFLRTRLGDSTTVEESMPRRPHPPSPSPLSGTKRLYIMEGPVQVTVGLQTQIRYLFLFNDVLIIAKPNKSCTLFRLKHRLRVCELWLATCIQEVSEVNSAPDTSFVLGWPTANNVLSFSSREEKELWWQSLSKHIEEERERQESKSVSIRVCNRDEESKTMQNKTFQVEYDQTSHDVLVTAMGIFNLPQDQHESYQLWVQSGKEEELYPLIGHEYPHSIKMNHTRDAAVHRDDVYFPDDTNQLSSAENELRGFQCVFILRKKGRASTGISQDTAGIQRRLRRNKKSPFKLNFRRSLSGKPSTDSSSEGLLFGKSLSVVCTEGEPPQPIMDLLNNLYSNGPFTHGIFRKSANARITKALRASLNAGEQCDLTDIHISVASSMLKDFLRSLPDCIFTGQLYNQWTLVNQLKEKTEKIDRIKSLMTQLPEANTNLLRYIFCIFHHITLNSEENGMTHTNLAICTSPSMMWPPLSAGIEAQALATKESPQLLQFMILHSIDIFGDDLATIFGAPPVRKETVCPLDSGDSDGVISKRNGSSMDSIEDLEQNNNSTAPAGKPWAYGAPPPLVSPSSLSRDSGITSSDNQIYPDSDNTDTTDSGVNSQERLNVILNSRFTRNGGYLASGDVILAPTRRGRTGSDPSVNGPGEVGKQVQLYPGGSTSNISPETLKLIEDVSLESCSTLLLSTTGYGDDDDIDRTGHMARPAEEHRPSGYHPSERLHTSVLSPASKAASKSTSMEQVPRGDPSRDPGRHFYARRVSAPSVSLGGINSQQPFSNRHTAARQSTSSISSSSSDRLSDGLSSSSTEKLFHGSPATEVDVTSDRLGIDQHRDGQLRAKSVSPRGAKSPARAQSFMKAPTPGSGTPQGPAVSQVNHRQPKHGRAIQGEEPPPSDFFPEVAMRGSLMAQREPDKDTTMKTIQENQEYQERTSHPDPVALSSPPRISVTNQSNHPPSYKESLNNRRIPYQRQSHSMDSSELLDTPTQDAVASTRTSAPNRVVSLERQRSKGKDRRPMTYGVFFHDSESSDDDQISDLENLRLQRSLSGTVSGSSSTNGSSKPRQVRRSSSDSKATSRRHSSSSAAERSAGHHIPINDGTFYGAEHVFEPLDTSRTSPAGSSGMAVSAVSQKEPDGHASHISSPRRGNQTPQSHAYEPLDRSTVDPTASPADSSRVNVSAIRQTERRSPGKSNGHVSHISSPHRGNQTPQGHGPQSREPWREQTTPKDRTSPNGLRRSLERDPLREEARKNWQRTRKVDSCDSGMSVDDYSNMDFDDESYV